MCTGGVANKKTLRLQWFSIRADVPNSPAAQALTLALDVVNVKKPHGRSPLRWMDIVRKDVVTIGLSLTEAAMLYRQMA